MKRTILYGFAALAILSLFAASVYAFPLGNLGKHDFSVSKNMTHRSGILSGDGAMQGRRLFQGAGMMQDNDIRNAMISGDYQAYLTAFDKIVSTPMDESEFLSVSAQVREQESQMQDLEEKRLAVENAINSGDYDSWLKAIEDSPRENELKSEITEERFSILVEMENARKDGDYEKARELADTLGFKNGFVQQIRGPRNNHGRGMGLFSKTAIE